MTKRAQLINVTTSIHKKRLKAYILFWKPYAAPGSLQGKILGSSLIANGYRLDNQGVRV
jgi:hypothetical protein